MNATLASKLFGRRVITRGGAELGQLVDLEVDSDSLRTLNIVVGSGGLMGKFSGKKLFIRVEDIIEINDDRIVVEEAIIISDRGSKVKLERIIQGSEPSTPAISSSKDA